MSLTCGHESPLRDGERWYLVQAQTGREEMAVAHLQRQGYRTFLPRTWRTIRHARQLRTVRTAYFPGYLFLTLDLARDRWRPIDGTVGVIRLVRAAERPLPAPRGLVEALLGMADPEGVLDRSGSSLEPGQTVRIIRGPFADQIAKIDRVSGVERVRVLLSIMNQAVPVELTRHDLALS